MEVVAGGDDAEEEEDHQIRRGRTSVDVGSEVEQKREEGGGGSRKRPPHGSLFLFLFSPSLARTGASELQTTEKYTQPSFHPLFFIICNIV
jgi:hypothetical protein